MVQDSNPYAAPSVSETTRQTPAFAELSVARYRWAVGLATVCVLGTVPASATAVYDIETILGSGPALLTLALCLLIVARPKPLRLLRIPALWIIVNVAVIFLWINLADMGPSRAQVPVGRFTVIVALVMQAGWATIYSVVREWHSGLRSASPAAEDPDQTASSG